MEDKNIEIIKAIQATGTVPPDKTTTNIVTESLQKDDTKTHILYCPAKKIPEDKDGNE